MKFWQSVIRISAQSLCPQVLLGRVRQLPGEQLAWLLSAPALCTTLMGSIDLRCNAMFEGTICHDRPEEEEMDLAGLRMPWTEQCQASSGTDWLARLQGTISSLLNFGQYFHIVIDSYISHQGRNFQRVVLQLLTVLDRNPSPEGTFSWLCSNCEHPGWDSVAGGTSSWLCSRGECPRQIYNVPMVW